MPHTFAGTDSCAWFDVYETPESKNLIVPDCAFKLWTGSLKKSGTLKRCVKYEYSCNW